jgi:hypothetical protein
MKALPFSQLKNIPPMNELEGRLSFFLSDLAPVLFTQQKATEHETGVLFCISRKHGLRPNFAEVGERRSTRYIECPIAEKGYASIHIHPFHPTKYYPFSALPSSADIRNSISRRKLKLQCIGYRGKVRCFRYRKPTLRTHDILHKMDKISEDINDTLTLLEFVDESSVGEDRKYAKAFVEGMAGETLRDIRQRRLNSLGEKYADTISYLIESYFEVPLRKRY